MCAVDCFAKRKIKARERKMRRTRSEGANKSSADHGCAHDLRNKTADQWRAWDSMANDLILSYLPKRESDGIPIWRVVHRRYIPTLRSPRESLRTVSN